MTYLRLHSCSPLWVFTHRARKSSIHAVMDLQEEQWNTGKEDPGQIAGVYQKITQDSQALARDEANEETEHVQKYLFDLIQEWQGGGMYSSWATSTTPPSRPPAKSILKQKSSNLPRSVYLLGHEPFPPTTVKQRLLHFINGGGGTPASIGSKPIEEPSCIIPPPPPPPSSRSRPTRIQAPSRTRSLPLSRTNKSLTQSKPNLNHDTSRTLTQLVGVIRGRRHRGNTGNPADSPTDESSMERSSIDEDRDVGDDDHDSDTDSDSDSDDDNDDGLPPLSGPGTATNIPRRQAPQRSRSTPLVRTKAGSPPFFSSSPPVQDIPKKQPLIPSLSPNVGQEMDSQHSIPMAVIPKKHLPKNLPKTQPMSLPKHDIPKKPQTNGSLPHTRQRIDVPTNHPLPKRQSPHPTSDRSTSFSKPTMTMPRRGPSPSVPVTTEGRNTRLCESKTETSKTPSIKQLPSFGKPPAATVSTSQPKMVAPKKHPPKQFSSSTSDAVAKTGPTTRSQPTMDARGKKPLKHSPTHTAVPPKKSHLSSQAATAAVPSKQPARHCPPPRAVPMPGSLKPTATKTKVPRKHPPKRSPGIGTPLAKASASSRSKVDIQSPLPKRGR